MPRVVLRLSAVVAVIHFGAGCSERAKPPAPSAFARDCDFARTFETVANRAGLARSNFSGVGHQNSAIDGTTGWKGEAEFCARPEQIDDLMRTLHAEFVKQVRAAGADVSGDPPAPGPVPEWRITYSAGAQEGFIQASRRHEGRAGPCDGAGVLHYRIDIAFEEAPKPAR